MLPERRICRPEGGGSAAKLAAEVTNEPEIEPTPDELQGELPPEG